MSERPADLDRLERWMLNVVTHPDGVDAGFRDQSAQTQKPIRKLEEVVNPGPHLIPKFLKVKRPCPLASPRDFQFKN